MHTHVFCRDALPDTKPGSLKPKSCAKYNYRAHALYWNLELELIQSMHARDCICISGGRVLEAAAELPAPTTFSRFLAPTANIRV
jgi:hypothetical protein